MWTHFVQVTVSKKYIEVIYNYFIMHNVTASEIGIPYEICLVKSTTTTLNISWTVRTKIINVQFHVCIN